MVPVSCPPWPGSMTMRPIFRPSARVRECCPSRVGLGSVGGFKAALLGAVDFDFSGVLFEAGVAASFAASLAVAESFSLLAETVSFVFSAAFVSAVVESSFAGASAGVGAFAGGGTGVAGPVFGGGTGGVVGCF